MYEKLALNYDTACLSKYFKGDERMLCDIGILIEICYWWRQNSLTDEIQRIDPGTSTATGKITTWVMLALEASEQWNVDDPKYWVYNIAYKHCSIILPSPVCFG